MHEASLTSIYYIDCPFCGAVGKEGCGSISHLLGSDTTFGPWCCESCGKAIEGEVRSGKVFVEKCTQHHQSDSLVLLRLDPLPKSLFLIAKGMYWDGNLSEEHQRYFYEEHTCPTNILRDAQEIIYHNDSDIHGFFKFLKAIPYQETMNKPVEELAAMFKGIPMIEVK